MLKYCYLYPHSSHLHTIFCRVGEVALLLLQFFLIRHNFFLHFLDHVRQFGFACFVGVGIDIAGDVLVAEPILLVVEYQKPAKKYSLWRRPGLEF